jgi:hypothetical protein
LAGFFGAVAQSVVCNGSDVIQTITDGCTPSGDSIIIRLIDFVGGRCPMCHGGAVYINGNSWVSLYSCSFLNWGSGSDGGCAFLRYVNSGSSVIDSCATKCGAYAGSFVNWNSYDIDVALQGLCLFDCSSEQGALFDYEVRSVRSRSNSRA